MNQILWGLKNRLWHSGLIKSHICFFIAQPKYLKSQMLLGAFKWQKQDTEFA